MRNHAKVSHFRICKSPGGSLYIQKGHPFPDMEELLAFYTEHWKVIQSPLLQPCSPAVSTPAARLGQRPGGGQGGKKEREIRGKIAIISLSIWDLSFIKLNLKYAINIAASITFYQPC